MSSKVIITIAILVAVICFAVLVVYDYNRKRNLVLAPEGIQQFGEQPAPSSDSEPAALPLPKPQTEPAIPQATGNIDNAVDSFLQTVTAEDSLSIEEDADANQITADITIIDDIGQSSDVGKDL